MIEAIKRFPCRWWHSYRKVVLVDHQAMFLSVILKGDVCRRCGHIHALDKKGAKNFMALLSQHQTPVSTTIVHPGVMD